MAPLQNPHTFPLLKTPTTELISLLPFSGHEQVGGGQSFPSPFHHSKAMHSSKYLLELERGLKGEVQAFHARDLAGSLTLHPPNTTERNS